MPLMLPPASEPGDLKFYWKDPGGTLRNFSRNDSPFLFVPKGSAGLGMAKFSVESDKLPFSPGALLKKINTDTRKLSIPIVVKEDNIADLMDVMEDLHDWFDTGDEETPNPGYFRVVRPDGSGREISGFYLSGLDGDMNEGGPDWVQYVIELLCLDPWPTALEEVTLLKTVAEAASFNVINTGRKFAWPVWKITGPNVSYTIANVTTGKSITVNNIETPNGNHLIIDTRPSELREGAYSVYDAGNNNRLYKVDPTDSDFWVLEPGSNNIQVTFTGGGTDANTTVRLTYLPRYKSLLR